MWQRKERPDVSSETPTFQDNDDKSVLPLMNYYRNYTTGKKKKGWAATLVISFFVIHTKEQTWTNCSAVYILAGLCWEWLVMGLDTWKQDGLNQFERLNLKMKSQLQLTPLCLLSLFTWELQMGGWIDVIPLVWRAICFLIRCLLSYVLLWILLEYIWTYNVSMYVFAGMESTSSIVQWYWVCPYNLFLIHAFQNSRCLFSVALNCWYLY